MAIDKSEILSLVRSAFLGSICFVVLAFVLIVPTGMIIERFTPQPPYSFGWPATIGMGLVKCLQVSLLAATPIILLSALFQPILETFRNWFVVSTANVIVGITAALTHTGILYYQYAGSTLKFTPAALRSCFTATTDTLFGFLFFLPQIPLYAPAPQMGIPILSRVPELNYWAMGVQLIYLALITIYIQRKIFDEFFSIWRPLFAALLIWLLLVLETKFLQQSASIPEFMFHYSPEFSSLLIVNTGTTLLAANWVFIGFTFLVLKLRS